jgi:hypothetical protein
VTVADLQKFLRSLAEVLTAAKGPSKEIEEAAAALSPFAGYKIADFGAFLKAVEAKYGATRELPDAKAPSTHKPKSKEPAPPKPTPEQLTAAIHDFKNRLARHEPIDRDAIESELWKFEKLTQPQIDAVMAGLGFPKAIKPKPKAFEAIVANILAPRIAADRANA